MSDSVPLWVRFVLALDKVFCGIGRTLVIARDELLWAWTSDSARERTNRALYSEFKTFYPGGETFEGGLFDWEREAVAAAFPGTGRILIGAVGAGRELVELAKQGYEVLAFEPALKLCETAKAVAKNYSGCDVVQASYDDFVNAVQSGSGPLASQLDGNKFDAVILGWISFSYVSRSRRATLLDAVRTVAPGVPVLLSYIRVEVPLKESPNRFRTRFRRFLSLAGAKNLAEPGDAFLPWMGFYYDVTTEEILSLADRAGYRPMRLNTHEAGYVLLEPR